MSKQQQQQYNTSEKFNARIYLNAKFSTNPYPWPLWVMDSIIQAYPQDRGADRVGVLELGCGNGLLWMANAERIPERWDITLTDYSDGMLAAARQSVGGLGRPIRFERIDAAEGIGYRDDVFDIVIANHMLYHLPDRDKALREIRRVLKPGGRLFASTIGKGNMLEMKALVGAFDRDSAYEKTLGVIEANFSLDNGREQLEPYFKRVEAKMYDDSLVVDEADAIVSYVLSCNNLEAGLTVLDPSRTEEFREYVGDLMAERGAIRISKESGLFVCGD